MSGGGVADPGPNRHAAILLHFQLNLPGSLSVRRRVTPLSVIPQQSAQVCFSFVWGCPFLPYHFFDVDFFASGFPET